jgi:hypothetical protein
MRAHRVRALLMGGQACVFYGAAEFRQWEYWLPPRKELEAMRHGKRTSRL